MKLIDKILHCPDEQGWTNPNISRSENLEKIADEYAIAFYEWRSTCLIKNIDQYTNKEAIEIFKKETQL